MSDDGNYYGRTRRKRGGNTRSMLNVVFNRCELGVNVPAKFKNQLKIETKKCLVSLSIIVLTCIDFRYSLQTVRVIRRKRCEKILLRLSDRIR